jgi:predicted GNAT family acetyltransferase
LKLYFNTAFIPEANKSKNHFYTFEKDDKIRAFMRFEKQKDNSLYASALNVDEASKSFGLGEAMMDEALTREAQNHILHASCRKDNPSNMRYFEKGFIASGFKKTNDTEELDLIWDEVKNKSILAKQKTVENLILMYLKNDYEGSIEIRKSATLEELHKDIITGKSLVRCFQDPLKTGAWYGVYESIDKNYGVNVGETK